jgi:hypothetical protein
VLAQSETQQAAHKSHFTFLEAELCNVSLAELALLLPTYVSHTVNFATEFKIAQVQPLIKYMWIAVE